jgi:ABC-2 type transport system ATP-binding protein
MSDHDGLYQEPRARVVIRAQHLGVRYRRYYEKVLTLKQTLVGAFRRSRYDEFWAVNDVSFDIYEGECVGIIGPNGAGKSTLLRAIGGIMQPSQGSVTAYGRIVPLIELGAGFNEELTGRENILLNGAILGLPRKTMMERTQKIIQFAELEDFIDVPLHNYSSGMRSRLGFSVACEVDPDILLLDEVFAVGDEAFRMRSTERMQQFFAAKKTIVMVSHSLATLPALCQRVLYLREGKIVADGAPQDVIDIYQEDVKRIMAEQQRAAS